MVRAAATEVLERDNDVNESSVTVKEFVMPVDVWVALGASQHTLNKENAVWSFSRWKFEALLKEDFSASLVRIFFFFSFYFFLFSFSKQRLILEITSENSAGTLNTFL